MIGIVGIVYTVYYGRRGHRRKHLAYQISSPIPLAQVFSPERDYRLAVLFQRKGFDEERIESVFTTFLKLANLGREPIRGADMAPANPVKVEVRGARMLDIQVAGVTRAVNNVRIEDQQADDEQASARLYFDFLDYQDGALIRLLSVGRKGRVSLTGDIIGMPEGIERIEETRTATRNANISERIVVGLMIGGLVLSAFLFRSVTGDWRHVWLVYVPLGVVIASILLTFTAEYWPFRRGRPSFPTSLDLPVWCRPYSIMGLRAEFLEMEMNEAAGDTEEGARRSGAPSEQ